jgi:poly(3-hydroxybutyrate) depolymerase
MQAVLCAAARIAALSIATLIPALTRYHERWKARAQAWRSLRLLKAGFGLTSSHLTEVHEFGSNPGALRMFTYVPSQRKSALVVVLHGCAQTAGSYDLGAGWSTLADRYGFALLLPQQQTSKASTGFSPTTSHGVRARRCQSAR